MNTEVFRYNGNEDRLELCLEPHGHFPIEPGIENKVLRSGLSATQDKDSDQMASLRDTLGSGSSGIIVNKPMQMPGQRPFSGQGHSMMSGSENIRMPHDLEMTSHRPRASSFHELNHDTPTSIVEEDEIAMEMDRKSSDGDSTMDERKEPAMFKRLGPGVTVLDHDTTNTVNSQTEMFQALASQIEDIVRDAEREDSDTEPRKISQVTDIVSETTQPPDGVATSEPMDSA